MFVKVKVVVESKKERVKKISENSYRIELKERAERGLANQRLLEILKKEYNTNDVRLVSGGTTPNKIFQIGRFS